jgi:uncharacterized protein involved in cysteine biosynthesis
MIANSLGASYSRIISTGVFLDNDDHLGGGSRWHRNEGWHNSKRCGGVSSIVVVTLLIVIFIFIVLTHMVESKLIGHLHDRLITRLDHSLQVGHLLLQPLGSIFLLLAQGL